MGTETERRFLIDPDIFIRMNFSRNKSTDIKQGYLSLDPERVVRIRLCDNDKAFLTIKGPKEKGSGSEFEYAIDADDAKEMMAMTLGLIEKTRYTEDYGDKKIEVDVFHGALANFLIIAEVEFPGKNTSFVIPHWFGPEITDDNRFSNVSLGITPIDEKVVRDILLKQ